MAEASANVLSLFAGIGGLDLGIRMAVPAARVVCFVERDVFAAEVLASRMEDASMDDAPIWTDIRTFAGGPWRGVVDIVTAGFPCQPWSAAGKRRGTGDDRWLWPAIERVIRDVEPRLVFLENVPGLVRGGIHHVLGSLAELGFHAEWDLFSAAEAGASQLRKRLFILADRHEHGRETEWCRRVFDGERKTQRHDADGCDQGVASMGGPIGAGLEERRCICGDDGPECSSVERTGDALADADGAGLRDESGRVCRSCRPGPAQPLHLGAFPPGPGDEDGWRRVLAERPDLAPAVEPQLRRLADGMAPRVERLRTAGSGVVPQQAAIAFVELWERLHA